MIKNLFSKRKAPDTNMSNEEQGASAEVLVQRPEPAPGEVVRDIAGLRVRIERFPAMDGFDLRRRTQEHAETKDRAIRRDFTIEVLSFAVVIASDGEETRLNSAEVINSVCADWTVLEAVFFAVLERNRIDPTSAEFHMKCWQFAGGEMAERLVATLVRLSGPAVEAIVNNVSEQKGEVKA